MHYTAESGSKRAGKRRECGEVVEEVCVCVCVCVFGVVVVVGRGDGERLGGRKVKKILGRPR